MRGLLLTLCVLVALVFVFGCAGTEENGQPDKPAVENGEKAAPETGGEKAAPETGGEKTEPEKK